MVEYQSVTRMDIESKLTPNFLLSSKIISSAMVVGPFLFFLIILFLNTTSTKSEFQYNQIETINSLLYVILALSFFVYSMFLLIPKIILKKEYLHNRLSKGFYDQNRKKIDDPVIKLINFDRIYMIIRLAMLEGISLFGIVILFLAESDGQLNNEPKLWLLIIPLLIQAYFTFTNYISKNKYVDRIENQILASLTDI